MSGSSGPLGQRHSFSSVLAWEVTLDPLHALPCSRCKLSLLGCSHTGTQRKLIFSHTLWALGGKRSMKTPLLFTPTPPPSPLPSCKFYCLGSNIQTCLLVGGGGSDMLELALSPFNFSPFKIFSCQETERLSLKLWGGEKKKIIWRGSIITGLLIRGMSCIITIVFNNTTVKHLEPLAKVSRRYYWPLIKFKKIWIDRALCTARWLEYCKVNEPIYILSAAIWVKRWRQLLRTPRSA